MGPTSLSSMVPGWKGGKVLPLGGSLGEYSLNDLEEQPAKKSNQKIDVYRSVVIDRVYAPCVKTDRPAGRNVPTQYVPLNRINKKSAQTARLRGNKAQIAGVGRLCFVPHEALSVG